MNIAKKILPTILGLPQNYIKNFYNNNGFLRNTGIDSKFLQDIPRDYQFGYVARPPLPIRDIVEAVGSDEDINDKGDYVVIEAGDEPEVQLYRKPASACKEARPLSRCYAAHTHWFYNFRTNTCDMFIFGGCGAGRNSNIFDSQAECDNLCVKK